MNRSTQRDFHSFGMKILMMQCLLLEKWGERKKMRSNCGGAGDRVSCLEERCLSKMGDDTTMTNKQALVFSLIALNSAQKTFLISRMNV